MRARGHREADTAAACDAGAGCVAAGEGDGMRYRHNVAWFYDECWRCSIHLLWPLPGKELTGKQIDKYLRNQFKDKTGPMEIPSDDMFDGRCSELGAECHGVHVISLREWEMTPKWISCLSHECFHATEQALSQRGMVLNDASSEAYAYLMQSMVKRCLDILTK